jgi:DNA-binding Lrp family transcriptional regulator
MAHLSETDKKLIFLLSGDLGDSPEPYAELAAQTGLSEAEVLAAVRRFAADGLTRRLGATLRHQKSGFTANAMVVWKIAADRTEAVGAAMAALPFVSHCYVRGVLPIWPYNLYTMVHAENKAQLAELIEKMTALAEGAEGRVLESLKEFKKASLRYFAPHH